MHGSLTNFDAMRQAITAAVRVDEVKDIRDKAEAMRLYYRQVNEGLEAQNEVAEIKIRAERRIGELLKGAELNKGGRPSKNRSHDATSLSLDDIGISKTQSSRWQTIAAVPDAKFEETVAKAKASKQELTSKSVYKIGKAIKQYKIGKAIKQAVPTVYTEPIEGVTDNLATLAGQKFGTIYADPPWAYDNKATRANVDSIYAGTMTTEELCELPVADLAAADAHLHMWVTKDHIFEANRILQAWGFEYRSMFVWCKEQIGIGNYWRMSHELMLLGIRGNAKSFARHDLRSWEIYERGEHSAKPAAIRDTIEDVSPGPYLELFGRERIEGWTIFGNQVSTHVQRRFA